MIIFCGFRGHEDDPTFFLSPRLFSLISKRATDRLTNPRTDGACVHVTGKRKLERKILEKNQKPSTKNE